jgi:hypothetical protein
MDRYHRDDTGPSANGGSDSFIAGRVLRAVTWKGFLTCPGRRSRPRRRPAHWRSARRDIGLRRANHLFRTSRTAIQYGLAPCRQSGPWGNFIAVALWQRETIMRDRFSGSMVTVAIAAATVGAAVSIPITEASAQAVSGTALKTPWGEPDLQGIWTDENGYASPASCQIQGPGVFHAGSTQ